MLKLYIIKFYGKGTMVLGVYKNESLAIVCLKTVHVSILQLREGNFGKTSSTIQKKSVSPPPTGVALEFTNRIVNSDFLESVDTGKCLSMHQPYASLLVAGIKKYT